MEAVTQLSYSVDTLYFLVCGALVMFMARSEEHTSELQSQD